MEWMFRILLFLTLEVPVKPGVILHAYPHDSLAYTQGLVFHDGFMYESTGLTKRSSLRKVDVKTGKVLFRYDLPSRFFGEGMTIYHNKIYQLTWKNRLCLVYDLQSMCFERAFRQGGVFFIYCRPTSTPAWPSKCSHFEHYTYDTLQKNDVP